MLPIVRRDPRQCEEPRSRWSLAARQRVCVWLKGLTPPGVSQIFTRLRVTYQRARDDLHRPDPDDGARLLTVRSQLREARQQATPRVVVLVQDEMTYERPPSVASADESSGHVQPRARRSHASATPRRIGATVEACSGRVVFRQASTLRIPPLIHFYEQVCDAYADQPPLIDLVQDHWPVHWHPDVRARRIPQTWAFPRDQPKNWPPTPRKTWPAEARLPIRIVPLPTAASWPNPLEKLGRWLRQDVLHLHRLADDWVGLQARVTQFLAQCANGSPDLLRDVGLSDLEAGYRSVFHKGDGSPPLPD